MGTTLLRRAWFTGKIFPLMMPLRSQLNNCSLNSRLPSLRTRIFFLREAMIGHDVQLVASNQISNICKCACLMHCTQTCNRVGKWLHVPCTQTCIHANREKVHASGQLEDVHRAVWEGLFPLLFICISVSRVFFYSVDL